MKKILFLMVVFPVILSGCAKIVSLRMGEAGYVLSCMNEMQGIRSDDFAARVRRAEEKLANGKALDQLHFVCLSLNEKADYRLVKKGGEVLDEYLEQHPGAREDMRGLSVLVKRLGGAEICSRSTRKKLIDEKNKLEKTVDSLTSSLEREQTRAQDLKSQIEQLKNIENIIKDR